MRKHLSFADRSPLRVLFIGNSFTYFNDMPGKFSELGKESRIWTGCPCQRDRCEACWVEKNLWEARGEKP